MSGNALASFVARVASLNFGGGARLESLPAGVCAVATVDPSPRHAIAATTRRIRFAERRSLELIALCRSAEKSMDCMIDVAAGELVGALLIAVRDYVRDYSKDSRCGSPERLRIFSC